MHPPIELPKNASYPSGHSTVGNLDAMILAELIPDQKDALLKRGQQIGDDRIVAGVHFPSDVEAGHKLAEDLFARLKANPNSRPTSPRGESGNRPHPRTPLITTGRFTRGIGSIYDCHGGQPSIIFPSVCESARSFRQGSSAVEQGTHKPLVGGSIPPSGTLALQRRAPFPARGQNLRQNVTWAGPFCYWHERVGLLPLRCLRITRLILLFTAFCVIVQLHLPAHRTLLFRALLLRRFPPPRQLPRSRPPPPPRRLDHSPGEQRR